MLNHDSLAIAAIFRDEFDYLLEWFAWHQIAGFKKFFIADNGSTDGTVALLEALGDLGIVDLIYQPVLLKRSQNTAYQRLSQQAVFDGIEALLYIDADEFLVHESMIDGDEYRCLKLLFDNPRVGMIGINWKSFGSSGHKLQSADPVLVRFTDYSPSMHFPPNGHIKSVSRLAYTSAINVHDAALMPGVHKIGVDGNELGPFIMIKDGVVLDVPSSGVTRFVINGPLRVHHYVIKSEQEYTEKKRRRGDAIFGVDHDRGLEYFLKHDFKGGKFSLSTRKITTLMKKIDDLHEALRTTVFSRNLLGVVDISSADYVQGWLVDEKKQSNDLCVNIFVNQVFQSRVACKYFRPNLKEKNISATGLSGFRYTHPKPLTPGDVVEVKVHANRYVFPSRSRVVIE